MWVGLQISVEKISIFGKNLVGPENAKRKKNVIYGKKLIILLPDGVILLPDGVILVPKGVTLLPEVKGSFYYQMGSF